MECKRAAWIVRGHDVTPLYLVARPYTPCLRLFSLGLLLMQGRREGIHVKVRSRVAWKRIRRLLRIEL